MYYKYELKGKVRSKGKKSNIRIRNTRSPRHERIQSAISSAHWEPQKVRVGQPSRNEVVKRVIMVALGLLKDLDCSFLESPSKAGKAITRTPMAADEPMSAPLELLQPREKRHG